MKTEHKTNDTHELNVTEAYKTKNMQSKPVLRIPDRHLGRLSVLPEDHCGFQVCLHSIV
jgi:hypothetical protein